MKKMLNLVLMLAFVVLCAASPVAAALISFNPSSPGVTEGTPVTVDVVISGLVDGAAPSLGAFDLDVTFDPSILNFSGATFGNQLNPSDPGIGRSAGLTGPGNINVTETSLETIDALNGLQADSFTLFSLTFDTVSEGTSALGLVNVVLGDAEGSPFQADLGAGLVTVTPGPPVPIPSALLLFGSGLMSGSLLRRRKTRG